MTVESATYISQLNAALPTGSDAKAEGDDHLRLVKAVLKANFPNFGAAALSATNTQLDKLVTTFSITNAPNNAVVIDSSNRVSMGLPSTVRSAAIRGAVDAYSSLAIVSNSNNGSAGGASLYFGNNNNDAKGSINYDTNNGALSVVVETVERFSIDANGVCTLSAPSSVPAISANNRMNFALPTNTQLIISVRGSDGATRTATLALA